jgi:hypothetical protein
MLTLTDTATGAEKEVMADSRLLAYLLRRVEAAPQRRVNSLLSPAEHAAEGGPGALGGRALCVVLSQCYHQVQVSSAPHAHVVDKVTEDHMGTEAQPAGGKGEGDFDCKMATASEVKLYWKLVWLSPADEDAFQQTSH